jgi:hypothetical protein
MATLLSFKQFDSVLSLNEASIVNQSDYGPGHKLELRKTANKTIAGAMGKDIEIAAPNADAEELKVGTGTESVYIKTDGKIIKIIGSKSTINSAFNHAGGGKSDTHKTTRCKEAMSVILFKHYHEKGATMEEDAAIKELPKYDADPSVYKSVYYSSAVLQLVSFRKIKKMGSMIFEFQGETNSAKIYAKSKVLGAPASPDNWNPADIWLFNSAFVSKMDAELAEMKHIQELNLWIRRNYLEKNIVPISLKQAEGKSSIELIEPIKYKDRKLKYDFTLSRVLIAGTCKSVFVETKSGFQFKANARAAKDNPNLFYEGTMKSENFSMGAIDKTAWDAYSQGKVPNGKDITPTPALLKKAAATYKKYKRNIVQKDNDVLFNPDFKKMDELFQQRYIHCADFLRFIMENYDDAMKFGFYASMKVSAINSMYLKIK